MLNRQRLIGLYQSQVSRHAIKTAIAAVVAILVYQYFHLPHGYWSVITALIVMQSNIDTGSLEMTLRVASQRLVGTVIGAALGLAIVFFFNINQWQLIVITFVLISVFAYVTRYYDGFKLAGVTALIILLLSNHDSITHSYAFMRVVEILLGVVIAVIVTICIWPYQISDHLKERRLKRLAKMHDLFTRLRDSDGAEVRSAFDGLAKDVDANRKMVKVAKKGLRGKQLERLALEDKVIRSLRGFGLSFMKLPQAYWDFSPLADATNELADAISQALAHLANNTQSSSCSERVTRLAAQYEKAFDGFRSYRRQAGVEQFSLDDSYQVINACNSLQRCAERVCDFSKLAQQSGE